MHLANLVVELKTLGVPVTPVSSMEIITRADRTNRLRNDMLRWLQYECSILALEYIGPELWIHAYLPIGHPFDSNGDNGSIGRFGQCYVEGDELATFLLCVKERKKYDAEPYGE